MLLFFLAHIPVSTDHNDWDLQNMSPVLPFPIYFLSFYLFYFLFVFWEIIFEAGKKVPCLAVFYTPAYF